MNVVEVVKDIESRLPNKLDNMSDVDVLRALGAVPEKQVVETPKV